MKGRRVVLPPGVWPTRRGETMPTDPRLVTVGYVVEYRRDSGPRAVEVILNAPVETGPAG